MVAIEKQTSRQNYELQNKYRRQIKGTENLCLFCKNNVISSVLLVFFFPLPEFVKPYQTSKLTDFCVGLQIQTAVYVFFKLIWSFQVRPSRGQQIL